MKTITGYYLINKCDYRNKIYLPKMYQFRLLRYKKWTMDQFIRDIDM